MHVVEYADDVHGLGEVHTGALFRAGTYNIDSALAWRGDTQA